MKKRFYIPLLASSVYSSFLLTADDCFSSTSSTSPPSDHQTSFHSIIAKNILRILLKYALTYDIDARSIDPSVKEDSSFSLKNLEEMKEKIEKVVQQNKPLEFNFVGFPFKSRNTTQKVLSPRLDAAERYSLEYLHQFLKEISEIYSPGASLTIFTDGTVFCDIEGIEDALIDEYETQLKKIAFDMPQIRIRTLKDLLPGKTSLEIRKIVDGFSPSLEDFHKKLAEDEHLQEELSILIKRMEFELGEHSKGKSAKDISTHLMHRSLQYSAFLSAYRSQDSIRLSVHYQPDVSKKMGIKLSENSFVTPWHGALILDAKGNKRIEHLKDISINDYQPTSYRVNGVDLAFLSWRRR